MNGDLSQDAQHGGFLLMIDKLKLFLWRLFLRKGWYRAKYHITGELIRLFWDGERWSTKHKAPCCQSFIGLFVRRLGK